MKTSLILSAALAILIVVLGVRNNAGIAEAREHQTKLQAEAASLGIEISSQGTRAGTTRSSRDRPSREGFARETAKSLVAFAREIEEIEKNGGSPDKMEGFQEKVLDFIDRMASLNAAELKILIGEFRAATGLKDETRRGLVSFAAMSLANDHPEAALGLFTGAPDLFPDDQERKRLVSSSLSRFARLDPQAAVAWIEKNSGDFPELITDSTRAAVVSGAAATDPTFAFKLIDTLGVEDTRDCINDIATASKTPSQRTATILAFRDYVAGLKDGAEKSQAVTQIFSNIAGQTAREGFESATRWVESADLTPAELTAYAHGVSFNSQSSETGKWLDWMDQSLPADKSKAAISQTMNNWTRKDFAAAGKWLADAPAGEMKNTAIASYARTVSPYEPQAAEQWALTLPAGKERESTLKTIHGSWPKDDAAGKAAFAEKHGIK